MYIPSDSDITAAIQVGAANLKHRQNNGTAATAEVFVNNPQINAVIEHSIEALTNTSDPKKILAIFLTLISYGYMVRDEIAELYNHKEHNHNTFDSISSDSPSSVLD